ncbi:hypothetical protein Ccrd_007094 [Cynara cardunculus var. scolymus]|uniref:Uncharacterized protein n=1 Tax=Cynara cardunculus var. scolymus TaxID=59895 RepID=A0A124SBJ9_CYNCS|nr:hypothetical protein Ccrd_007094 [Cynara cardunculus var. scolymus]
MPFLIKIDQMSYKWPTWSSRFCIPTAAILNPDLRKWYGGLTGGLQGAVKTEFSGVIDASSFMEAMKMMKLFAVMVVMMMAVSAISVSATDAPAPAPTSGATTVVIPTAVASLSAIVFAFLF